MDRSLIARRRLGTPLATPGLPVAPSLWISPGDTERSVRKVSYLRSYRTRGQSRPSRLRGGATSAKLAPWVEAGDVRPASMACPVSTSKK